MCGVRRGLLFALAALPLLGGCAAIPKLEAPKLSVVAITLQSADIFSQRLNVRMRVLNPNSRELPVKGLSFRVEVNGAQLGQGLMNAPFTVPALGEAEFDTQVTANAAGTLLRLLSRRDSTQKIDYRLVGDVSLSSGFLRRIPFDERGSIDLK